MPIRRVGRPGLIGLAARTAVVAGTAQAVSGRVAENQQRRAQSQYEREQEQYAAARQQAQVAIPSQAVSSPSQQPVAPAPTNAGADVLAQLQQLADLKQSGLLTDEEFAAAKAKLLG